MSETARSTRTETHGTPMNGLSTAEATVRLSRDGPNALPEHAPDPLWRRFVRQFQSPLIYILLFALAFDLGLWIYEGAHAWPIEATAIGLILLFNAALGLYQEQRSEAALTRLKALAGAQAWVLRVGHLIRLPLQTLVPGDAVRLEAGDRVPADGTLMDARSAMLDESILTGESIAVDKSDGDEAFSGTLLVRGKAFLEVTRTGRSSAMGRLATMLGDIQAAKTSLEPRVDELGRQLARWGRYGTEIASTVLLSAALLRRTDQARHRIAPRRLGVRTIHLGGGVARDQVASLRTIRQRSTRVRESSSINTTVLSSGRDLISGIISVHVILRHRMTGALP
jgi:magnesium-transporting ATPase (P-type)